MIVTSIALRLKECHYHNLENEIQARVAVPG
jgi:hypothetical protein